MKVETISDASRARDGGMNPGGAMDRDDDLTGPSIPNDEQLIARYAILDYFRFDHLPPHLQERSKPFSDLAWAMVRALPCNAETSAGLRKLLEAKDCFVRAALPKRPE